MPLRTCIIGAQKVPTASAASRGTLTTLGSPGLAQGCRVARVARSQDSPDTLKSLVLSKTSETRCDTFSNVTHGHCITFYKLLTVLSCGLILVAPEIHIL